MGRENLRVYNFAILTTRTRGREEESYRFIRAEERSRGESIDDLINRGIEEIERGNVEAMNPKIVEGCTGGIIVINDVSRDIYIFGENLTEEVIEYLANWTFRRYIKELHYNLHSIYKGEIRHHKPTLV